MNLYRILDTSAKDYDTVLDYAGTREDAQESAKDAKVCHRDFVRIELVEVPTDKEGLLRLLKSVVAGTSDNLDGITVVRTWALTLRGRLKEVANGE